MQWSGFNHDLNLFVPASDNRSAIGESVMGSKHLLLRIGGDWKWLRSTLKGYMEEGRSSKALQIQCNTEIQRELKMNLRQAYRYWKEKRPDWRHFNRL